jgi:hypothetical protein
MTPESKEMRMRSFSMALALTSIILASAAMQAAPTAGEVQEPIPLAGTWRFELDRGDMGMGKNWASRTLPGTVRLPGSLPGQGIGDPVTVQTKWTGGIVDRSFFTSPEYAKYRQPGNVKVPFWLQPETYYAGPAWYQRDIVIPAGWQDRRVVLSLERPHWETRVWVDGRPQGVCNALGTPHEHDLGRLPPGKHVLTIRVDNRMVVDVGENSHSVSDHMQGNWNGIVGRIELRATPLVWIDDVQVYPNVAKRSALLKVCIGNATGAGGNGTLVVTGTGSGHGDCPSFRSENGTVPLGHVQTPVTWDRHGGACELEAPLGAEAKLWDEFSPVLQTLTVSLGESRREVKFGLHEFTARGTQFAINGRPMFIRGTLDCCCYPRTGHPPADVAEWKRIIGVIKAHGLNAIRFHSWCPPEAAFTAADELGCYLHVEASSWANQSTTLGDGKPVDKWLYEETDRILKHYGNHPSFVLMPSGNEPGGKHYSAWLARWVGHYKARDPRRLFTSGAGWPELPENQWHSSPTPRVQGWGQGLKSRINALPPETASDYREFIGKHRVPVVSHEIGQWCVYPNFDEVAKYTGYLKPRNFDIFRDRLAEHRLLDQARQFFIASGKLQALCYKEDIESALRTPGMAGFELLELNDFPGQGTALVGVLDPFWEEKGYITPAAFRRFSNSTVVLARLPKRVFTSDETLTARLEVAHFGPKPLENVVTTWRLVPDGGIAAVAEGKLPAQSVPVGNGTPLGTISLELEGLLAAPARYKLVVGFEGMPCENDWDVWVYPARAEARPAADVKIVDRLDNAALAALRSGGKVFLAAKPARVRNAKQAPVILGFSSIFWNTAWTGRQPPTTLGILCDPAHPALASFPTDFHSNWQWWYVITRAKPMILDDLPPKLKPVVQVIDDWFTARRLGLVFEAKVGGGRLLVTSIDLSGDLSANPVARQLRQSLLRYMSSDKFQPAVEADPAAVKRLFE